MIKVNYKKTIIKTNWVHIVGFYITSYLALIFLKLIGLASEQWSEILIQNLWTIPFAFLTFGLVVLFPFYLAIIFFDLIVFDFCKDIIIKVLLLEWLIISSPFIYYAISYKSWIWLPLSISFLIL